MDTEAHEDLNTPETPAVQAQRRFSVWRQCRAIFALHPRRLAGLVVQAYSDGSLPLPAFVLYLINFMISFVIATCGVEGQWVTR